MRKLLLATVAVLGASFGLDTVASAQTAAAPEPGTVTVRLNGRVRFYAYGVWDQNANNNSNAANPLAANAGVNKLANYGFLEYGRLYPGFDGVAANGLKYGASLEIRQDVSAGAGGGALGSISGQNAQRSLLYFRRTFGYIGTDGLGTVRLGATDQPTSLYLTGNFENFDGGGLNGDATGINVGVVGLVWPFSDVGSYYTTNKAVYLSPQLYGFDFGVSWEPSTANTSGGNFAPSGIAGIGADRLSSSPSNAESARRRNTVDALIRYRGTFAGFGIAATAAYIKGSHVNDNQNSVAFNNNPLAGTARYNYEGLNAGDFGLAVTYAGFSVGGHYLFGRYNGNIANPVPKGFTGGDAWLVGASYTAGPVVVGAHYLHSTSAGNLGNAFYGRQRFDQGVAAGATYSVAPGLSFFLSYLYQSRRQNGFDFINNTGVTSVATGTGVAGNPNNNQLKSSLIAVGTSWTW